MAAGYALSSETRLHDVTKLSAMSRVLSHIMQHIMWPLHGEEAKQGFRDNGMKVFSVKTFCVLGQL